MPAVLLRRSLRTATKALTAQWVHFAPRLFIQLGYIDKDLLESIDIEAQKRREEDKAHGPRTDPSGGASEPITSGKREAKPTVESQEARAARKTLKECEKTMWRLQLGRVEPPYDCAVCNWEARGMGLVAREHCVLDSVRWPALSPDT